METPEKPSFKEALTFWFKLGWISFGGPAGQIAIMHTYLVEQKRWISEKKFLHALNYCMLLPGPEAQQLATYTGWLLHGKRGGLAAGILFVLPSAFILLILSILYVQFGHIAEVNALFEGLKPAVVAIVALAMVKIGKRSLKYALHVAIAILSFVAIYFFNFPFPAIIGLILLFGLLALRLKPSLLHPSGQQSGTDDDESGYFLTTATVLPHTGFEPLRLVKQIGVFGMAWLLPFILLTNIGDRELWSNVVLFFSQAAFVTFGGAYAVLPYVSQQAVEHYQWLGHLQMIDGLALGETTPGPLIMVLAFVGFMAGYGYSGSLAMGTLGLFATTYYTFLPCFLFIFAGAPLIEKTQQNPNIKAVLGLVTAAVTGVILNLTLYFAEAVVYGKHITTWSDIRPENIHPFALIWIVISLIAMGRFKIGMITWIGISAIFGLITYLLA
ncbi:MAG TPA: chromate efflux transporter [Chitinophagales bacterium]|nr:chromate efflux transporter [Chitinophagales bacterium]